MVDGINGHPREMDEFAFLAPPDLFGAVARNPPAGGCAGPGGWGMQECKDMVAQDNASTVALHQFLTKVAQGFTAYKSMVHTCAERYGQADQLSADEINRSAKYDPRSNLPDLAPEFTPAR